MPPETQWNNCSLRDKSSTHMGAAFVCLDISDFSLSGSLNSIVGDGVLNFGIAATGSYKNF